MHIFARPLYFVLFYFVFTPVAMIWKLVGGDPLVSKRQSKGSHWCKADPRDWDIETL